VTVRVTQPRLLAMEDPEAWLRAITAPLARAREGSPYPVTRLSLEAVANAFVVLGLLPAARAEEVLAAQRPVLEAAGFRVGREIGELSVNPGARSFQEARAAALDSPRQIPLAVAAGPVRCRLPRHDLAITWATLTPEGIQLRYHGDARDGDRDLARALAGEITEDITELSITDDTGGTYRVPAANVPGGISGQCSASGETRWIPEGEFLAVPVRGGGPAVRWLELSAGSGPPVRVEISSPATVPTGTTQRCSVAAGQDAYKGSVRGAASPGNFKVQVRNRLTPNGPGRTPILRRIAGPASSMLRLIWVATRSAVLSGMNWLAEPPQVLSKGSG
jgi:hypothetical protein